MASRRRKFNRSSDTRNYKKLFLIATEGSKTEPQYFEIFNRFNNQHSVIKVQCLTSNHNSSPPHVLKRMKHFLNQENLKKTDEAWIVIDRDEWTEQQLTNLHTWSTRCDNYGFALSNPKFEYWLLLHFEDGNGIQSANDCSNKLKSYIKNYDKNIDIRKIQLEQIEQAIERAKQRDIPACTDWPRNIGTTVYKLVEKILNA
ncbi:MAG: RloB family protein [Gammaproteobacteria bacterium]